MKHPHLNQKKLILIILISFFVQVVYSQQNKTISKKATANFYTIRDAILKDLNEQKTNQEINEENREEDNSLVKFKRWEQFVAPRVFPTGEFFTPDVVYNEYLNYYKTNSNKLLSTNNTWEALGPFTDMSDAAQTGKVGVGRINCLAQHPTDSNTLYIGTMGGGIWKTTNGGLNWVSLNDDLPSMSFSDIAVNPIHPDTIYAASGDAVGNYTIPSDPDFHQGHYSAGILMSPDGGATWNQTGFTYQQFETVNIYRIVLDPVNTQNILAGTESGLYRSTDAGVSWIQLDTTIVYDIQINPLDPQKYYAITDEGVNMKISYDGGATWTITNATPITGGAGRSQLRISPADTSKLFVIRGNGRLFRSINAGATFTTIGVPGNTYFHQGDYDKAFAISPTNTDNMLLGFVELIKSTNGGTAFNLVDSMYSFDYGIHVDFHSLQYSNSNSNKVYATNDGGVYVSYDEGQSWTSLNNGLNITQYYKMSSSFMKPEELLGGAQDNSTHFYDGTSWTVVTCCDGLDCSFDKNDENTAYASIQNGFIYRSDDGGNTFSTPITPSTFVGTWETPHLVNPLNSNSIYIAGSGVLVSYDRGTSWQNLSPTLDSLYFITSIAQSAADTNIFYAASYDHVFFTNNYGTTWIDVTASLPVGQAAIYDLKVSDTNPLEAYVTLSGFSAGNKVYKTANGGGAWTNLSGTLPNIPCNTIIIQKNTVQNDLYIGTDFGVFYYNDSIADWIPYNTGLPGVIVADLDLNYRSGKLFAGTHGRGIYQVDPVTAVQPLLNDAAISKIIAPFAGDYCDSLFTPIIVQIKNYGADTLTSVDINYSIDNLPVVSASWTGSLATNDVFTDTLSTLTLYGGPHTIKAFTSNPNGAGDDVPTNDSKTRSVNINTAISAFPFAEGFENAFPPADWYLESGGLWKQGLVGAVNASLQCAMANFYDIQSGTGFLTTMRIDLTSAQPSAYLGFAHAYAQYDPTYVDTFAISITNDCTDNWTTIYSKSDTALTTVPGYILNPFTPAANEWAYTYLDISAYIGQIIKVRFEARSGYSNNLYLDDINLFHSLTSIAENNLELLQVYPNPTTGLLNITDPAKVITCIEVYNQQGQLVMERKDKSVHTPINLDTYSQNLYFIKLHTKKGVVTKKVTMIK